MRKVQLLIISVIVHSMEILTAIQKRENSEKKGSRKRENEFNVSICIIIDSCCSSSIKNHHNGSRERRKCANIVPPRVEAASIWSGLRKEDGREKKKERNKMKRCNVCATTKQTHFAALQFEEHTYSARKWEPNFVQFHEKQGRRIRNCNFSLEKSNLEHCEMRKKKEREMGMKSMCRCFYSTIFINIFSLRRATNVVVNFLLLCSPENIHRYTLPCLFCEKWKFCNPKTCLSSLECV